MDSDGHKALREGTQAVLGEVKPFSITGSLPLVGDLQKAGFDIQVYIHMNVHVLYNSKTPK